MNFFEKLSYTLNSKALVRKHVVELIRKRKQNLALLNEYRQNHLPLIVYIVPGAQFTTGKEIISGGILSIDSIFRETKKLFKDKNVLLATPPDAYLLENFKLFQSSSKIFRFSQIEELLTKESLNLTLHIPEYLVTNFLKYFEEHPDFKNKTQFFHINILNQNITYMPSPNEIKRLKDHCNLVTQTTAHEKYCNLEMREKYQIPLHKFSVFSSPERYEYVPYQKKKKVIAISPDEHPLKRKVVSLIEEKLPEYKIVVIQNFKYEDYLQLISTVEFTITFGEGLDFYFIETVFSGGVGIAVFNEDFFTEDFKGLPGVFDSYESLEESIVDFIKKTRLEESAYEAVNLKQFKPLENLYSREEYRNNIIKFYQQKYTFE